MEPLLFLDLRVRSHGVDLALGELTLGVRGQVTFSLGLQFPRACQVGLQAFPRGSAEQAQPDTGSGLENVAGWHQLAGRVVWAGGRTGGLRIGWRRGIKLRDWPDQRGPDEALRGAGACRGVSASPSRLPALNFCTATEVAAAATTATRARAGG